MTEDQKSGAITVVTDEVTPLSGDAIIEIARNADARIAAMIQIKEKSLRVTNHNDWVDQKGKPYLQASGCEKVARCFGLSWRFIGDQKKVPLAQEGHYRYDTRLEIIWNNVSIEVVGSRSSNTSFFTTYYTGKGNSRVKHTKPGSEVDEANVMKASMTNAIGSGITRMLGMRNLTWAELNEAGIYPNKTVRIDYDGSNKAAKQPPKNPKAATPQKPEQPSQSGNGSDNPCTTPQKEAIGKMLTGLHITDDHDRMERVSTHAGREGVISNLMVLTIAEASAVITGLGKDFGDMKAAEEAEESVNSETGEVTS